MMRSALTIVLFLGIFAGCGTDEPDESGRGGEDTLICSVDDVACLTSYAGRPRTPVATATAFFPTTATAETAQTASAGKTPPVDQTPVPGVTASSGTGISGIVLIGPQCPVVREGEECPDKPYEAIIEIRDPAGQVVASIASGADGRFRVVLPRGTYTLVARPRTNAVLPAPVEMTVSVELSGFTDIVVSMDSGIR